MSTSQTAALFDPTSDERISSGTLAYIRARNKNALYNLIVREFKKSGLTQTQLAKRMGRTADVVCRLLARPSNVEIDTASDFLFAICGAAMKFEPHHPIDSQDAKATLRSHQTGTTAVQKMRPPQWATHDGSAKFGQYDMAA